tara:strand:- start:1192 stop:2100 length:909 start_codon:yes stop_codon:yes gene_type:complete
MINLGLVGAGKWGKNYINTINRMPGIRLAAVVSSNSETRNFVQTDVELFSNWSSIIDISLDGLILAVPPKVQTEIAMSALKARLPLLLEKPMALDPKEAEKINKASREQKAFILVNHIYLHHPVYMKLKQLLINEGSEIKAIHTQSGNRGPFRKEWSALWDWGPHDLAMALDLVKGPASVKKVSLIKRDKGNKKSGNYLIQLSLSNGATADLKFGNLMPNRVRQLRVQTDTGEYIFDETSNNRLKHFTKSGEKNIPVDDSMPLDNLLRYFVKHIKGAQTASYGSNQAVQNIQLLADAESTLK